MIHSMTSVILATMAFMQVMAITMLRSSRHKKGWEKNHYNTFIVLILD